MNHHTIILAHGIARFDYLADCYYRHFSRLGIDFGWANNELHYFKEIARHLRNYGFNVYTSSVSFAGSLAVRAADLEREVEIALALRPSQTKVHIIAHSMGGLDARFMICNLGMADKVASLTTIGTPHFGTSFADWGIQNGGSDILKVTEKIINLRGFGDLTTYAASAFNDSAESSEAENAVFYQTFAASESLRKTFAPLQSSWQIINANEGANDGLVSVSSQRWKGELSNGKGITKQIVQKDFPVSADHLNEIGWWDFNQLQPTGLSEFNLLKTIRSYENSVKNAYLEIARDVQMV